MKTVSLSEIISNANGVVVSMINQMTGFEVFGNKITVSNRDSRVVFRIPH